MGPLHKFGCGIPEKVIVAYDSDNNPIFAEIIREGELGECEGKTGSCSPYPCTMTLAVLIFRDYLIER